MLSRSRYPGLFALVLVLFCLVLLEAVGSRDCLANYGREKFILTELNESIFISQREKASWGDNWSAPTSSAIVFAYLAKSHYTSFIDDVNGNGRVDKPDLVPLADKLGTEYLNTTEPGTKKVDLVEGLAKFISDSYPNEFVLKVYDSTFKDEYNSVKGKSLSGNIYGTRIEVLPDATYSDYRRELLDGEMIWLGLPQPENEAHFLVGRSFINKPSRRNYYPVDLVDPYGSLFGDGSAKVIETEMSQGGSLLYKGEELKPELMLALSPFGEPEYSSYGETPRCPPDAYDYDVNRIETEYGAVEIIQCVTRKEMKDGTIYDTYTYTLTNHTYSPPADPMVTVFALFSPSMIPEEQVASFGYPEDWLITLSPNPDHTDHTVIGWLTLGSGLQPGEETQVSVTVLGPTESVPCNGLYITATETDDLASDIHTTCPRIEEPILELEVVEEEDEQRVYPQDGEDEGSVDLSASGGPDLTCSVSCEVRSETVCVEWSSGDQTCEDWQCCCDPDCNISGGQCVYPCTEPEHNGVCCKGYWRCTSWETEAGGECLEEEEQFRTACTIEMQNVGDSPSGFFTGAANFFVDGSRCPVIPTTITRRSGWLSLDPGESSSITAMGEPTSTFPCLPVEVTCEADIFNEVDEENEENNENEWSPD